MKKVFAIAIVGLAVLTSCKKDYTCSCTADDGNGTTATSEVTYHATKKTATESCEGASNTSSGITTTCKLK